MLWERAYSTSSWTKPSVASILTGLYPSEHGAFRGVKRRRGWASGTTDRLSASTTTLAERLTAAGWRCGAFLNNAQLGTFTNFHRGFETYEPTAGKADALLALLEAWLSGDSKKPVFAYVHFLEAHWPYKPRRRHIAAFGGNRDTNRFSTFSARDYGLLRRQITRGERSLSEDEVVDMTLMYDSSVRRLDGKIKRIVKLLQDQGLYEDAALAVTSDHGEELWDRGTIGHGHSLSEPLTHVPLIIHDPRSQAGIRHSMPVSLVDLAPTILAMAGVEPSQPGRNLVDGKDEHSAVGAELAVGHRFEQAFWTGTWKMVRQTKAEQPIADVRNFKELIDPSGTAAPTAFYDLRSDPQERINLVNHADSARDSRECWERMKQWSAGLDARFDASQDSVVDDTVLTRIRDLGYLD